jgi:hypothetical protein
MREKLIVLARENPELRERILTKIASADDDAAAFATWAILSNPTAMTETEVKQVLAKAGVNIKPPMEEGGEAPSRGKTGALEVGEIVLVDGSKCTNPNNQKLCAQLSYSPTSPVYFLVKSVMYPEDIDALCSVVVSPIDADGEPSSHTFIFEAAYPTRIAGLTKSIEKAEKKGDLATVLSLKQELREKSVSPHEGLGLYRTGFSSLASYKKYLDLFESSTKFIVVYERGGKAPTPTLRSGFISSHVQRTTQQTRVFGEFRDVIDDLISYASRFYTGPIKFGAHNSEGALYFSMDTKRSRGVDSMMSPSKGKVYYIAPVSDLPKKWKEDLRARLADLAEEEGEG